MKLFRRATDTFVGQTLRNMIPGLVFAAALVLIHVVVQVN